MNMSWLAAVLAFVVPCVTFLVFNPHNNERGEYVEYHIIRLVMIVLFVISMLTIFQAVYVMAGMAVLSANYGRKRYLEQLANSAIKAALRNSYR